MQTMQRSNLPTGPDSGGRPRRRVRIRALVALATCLGSITTVAGLVTPSAASASIAFACHGSLTGGTLNQPIVGITATPDQGGYWLVASDGGVFSFGDAGFFGSTGNLVLNEPVVGMATTADGRGYWLVASDGGVFSFGDAGFFGSTGNLVLNEPVVGMAATPDGLGYWLVASDGGVFSFGDAGFYGSTGNLVLNEPVIGMGTTPDGRGYWLAAADAGVFSFGDAYYLGGGPLSQDGGPIVTDFSAFAATTDGMGYLIAAANRAFILNFGNAKYYGLASSASDQSPLAGITAPDPSTGFAYWEATAAGSVYALDASGQATC